LNGLTGRGVRFLPPADAGGDSNTQKASARRLGKWWVADIPNHPHVDSRPPPCGSLIARIGRSRSAELYPLDVENHHNQIFALAYCFLLDLGSH
jgi:hypothetical protein